MDSESNWFQEVVEDARQKTRNRPASRRSHDVNEAYDMLGKTSHPEDEKMITLEQGDAYQHH